MSLHNRLNEMYFAALPSVAAPVNHEPIYTLFLSFSDGEERASVLRANGQSFERAWLDVRRRAIELSESTQCNVKWLRLDWVTVVRATTWGKLRNDLRAVKRNYCRWGIALDNGFDQAFLEMELNANAMLYSGNHIPNAQLNESNFAAYARKKYPGWQGDFSAESEVYLFGTRGVFCDGENPVVELKGMGRDAGRRIVHDLDEETVLSIVQQGSQYLAAQVGRDGRFQYGLHPCFDRTIKTYNALRHCSTIYAMLEAWEVTNDSALKQAIVKGLGYIVDNLIWSFPVPNGEAAFLVEHNGEIKLGGNGVCLLALTKYSELFHSNEFLPLLERLAVGIEYMQDDETGRFSHVLQFPSLSVKDEFRVIYYDGEAAFGLMRLYGLTGDHRWLAMVEKAFDWFIGREHWKANDHWLAYCVNELTRYRPEERYFKFGLQNVAGHLEFVMNRITTFPTLLELMMATQKIIQRIHLYPEFSHLLNALDQEKFYEALEWRAVYLLNGFFWPEMAMYFKKPSKVVGSFFIRHHAFRVRIDDVEHYLSGFVAYLKYLRSKNAKHIGVGGGDPQHTSGSCREAERRQLASWDHGAGDRFCGHALECATGFPGRPTSGDRGGLSVTTQTPAVARGQ